MKLKMAQGGAELAVSDDTFAQEYNQALVFQVVNAYRAAGRAGTKAQKTRAEVRGGGRKPHAQKGTGSARAGAVVANALASIPNPLVNVAVTVTALAGITGSASGGMSIALAAMAETFITNANAANIPMDVLHRVAAMASGGMDTLPHNGAVITLLAVTGLTHRQAYKDIFAITIIKTMAVFFIIAVFYLTGWV